MRCGFLGLSAGFLLIAAFASCSSERETLLQFDLVLPQTVAVRSVRLVVGDVQRGYLWDSAALRPSVGIDMRLPRSLTGDIPVVVQALDEAGCVVASQSTIVQLQPGELKKAGTLVLDPLQTPICEIDPDGGVPNPDDGVPSPVEAGADRPPFGSDAHESEDTGTSDGARDARPPVDVSPDGPRTCAAGCASNDNCVAGLCQPTAPDCKKLKSAGLGDGVYWVQVDGRPQRAYCDMQAEAVLCASKGLRQGGVTREGSGQHFSLWSELQAGEATCKIWAVRNQDGYPMTKLYPAPGLTLSTCQAFGFKGGDGGISMVCKYGSDAAHGYGDCGFGKRPFYKWGNSCDCSLVNGQRPARFVLEKGDARVTTGVYESGIPWNADGAQWATCAVK